MISTNTVLILGAGASQPYGFPLGRQLLNRICQQLGPEKHTIDQYKVLIDLGRTSTDIENFRNALRYSDYGSVDEFLEYNPDYMDLGKLVIASALIPYEDEKRLFPPHAQADHWYKLLADALEVKSKAVCDNQLSVLTFNYDRSLEVYLLTVIQERRHCSLSEAVGILQSIPIVHLYGDLGQFGGTSQDAQKYSPDLETARVKAAAGSMKIMHESEDQTPEFDEGVELLEKAERICFLGFGYHPTNVRRLRVFNSEWGPERKQRQIVSGTSQGIEPQEWESIATKVLHGNFGGSPLAHDCFTFLRRSALS